jgi:tRNA-splicing endonuclease subunit Sen54
MADADEDVPQLGAQDGAENDPTEEAQDFRFLDKLMCACTPLLVQQES